MSETERKRGSSVAAPSRRNEIVQMIGDLRRPAIKSARQSAGMLIYYWRVWQPTMPRKIFSFYQDVRV